MYKIDLPTGKYVVAVSGGVDSVVLLDLLAQQDNLELVVAHFDHGIRDESRADAAFVQKLAQKYGFKFITERAELGQYASEETARKARYAFLRRVKKSEHAQAIVMAHHQDDVLETAVINLLRGTGWRGLSSLRDGEEIRRPLLGATKAEILEYARACNLRWREDATNADLRYLRNRVRREILPRASDHFRREMLALIARQGEIRGEVAQILAPIKVEAGEVTLPRTRLIMLPNAVGREVLATGLLRLTGNRAEQHMLHRMLIFAKTARRGKTLQINGRSELIIQNATVVVRRR